MRSNADSGAHVARRPLDSGACILRPGGRDTRRRPTISNRLRCSLVTLGLAALAASVIAQETQPSPPSPKVTFNSPAGMLLVQVKPGDTATFEEMMARLHDGLLKTQDATLKSQAAGFAVFKVSEPFGGNTLYVVRFEPIVPTAEYDLFNMWDRTMTEEERKAPAVVKMRERYAAVFAGYHRMSLTPVDLPAVLQNLEIGKVVK